jgi:hypothetical protein
MYYLCTRNKQNMNKKAQHFKNGIQFDGINSESHNKARETFKSINRAKWGFRMAVPYTTKSDMDSNIEERITKDGFEFIVCTYMSRPMSMDFEVGEPVKSYYIYYQPINKK